MALEMLPKFEQAIFESKLRPTMLQLIGSLPHPGPWDADHGHKRVFPTKLQEYHDMLVAPENRYDITPSHLISKKVGPMRSLQFFFLIEHFFDRLAKLMLTGSFALDQKASSVPMKSSTISSRQTRTVNSETPLLRWQTSLHPNR